MSVQVSKHCKGCFFCSAAATSVNSSVQRRPPDEDASVDGWDNAERPRPTGDAINQSVLAAPDPDPVCQSNSNKTPPAPDSVQGVARATRKVRHAGLTSGGQQFKHGTEETILPAKVRSDRSERRR